MSRASYHAEVLPGDVLAYRVTAELATADPRIRIGWQGSAKVYGGAWPAGISVVPPSVHGVAPTDRV